MGVKWHRGRWQVDLKGAYICTAPDRPTALMLEQAGKRLLALGKPLDDVKRELRGEGATPSVGRCFDAWFATLTCSEDTKYRYRLNFGRAVNDLRAHPVSSVTTADLRRSIAAMTRKGYSPKTVRVSMTALLSVLRHAVEEGHITSAPALPRKALPENVPTRKPHTITREQYRLMLAACPEHFRPMVAVMPLTGLRMGEVLGLTHEDVSCGEVRVRKQVRANQRRRSKTKTPASAAPVPLVPMASWWLCQQLEYGYGSAQGLLFCNPQGHPWGRSTIRRLFLDLGEAAGVEVRPHDLRHTAGSWLLAAAIPLPDVSRFLRHKDPAFTARVYSHAVDDTPAMDRFADYLSGT